MPPGTHNHAVQFVICGSRADYLFVTFSRRRDRRILAGIVGAYRSRAKSATSVSLFHAAGTSSAGGWDESEQVVGVYELWVLDCVAVLCKKSRRMHKISLSDSSSGSKPVFHFSVCNAKSEELRCFWTVRAYHLLFINNL